MSKRDFSRASAILGRGLKEEDEKRFLDNLFAHVSKDNVRRTYIEPVLERLLTLQRNQGPSAVPYDKAFKAFKRAARELADDWKLNTTMVWPVSKAGLDRQLDTLARSFMEVYFARLGAQRGQDQPVSHGPHAWGKS